MCTLARLHTVEISRRTHRVIQERSMLNICRARVGDPGARGARAVYSSVKVPSALLPTSPSLNLLQNFVLARRAEIAVPCASEKRRYRYLGPRTVAFRELSCNVSFCARTAGHGEARTTGHGEGTWLASTASSGATSGRK